MAAAAAGGADVCAMPAPCAFIFHGGGPMPLLGQQPAMVESLQTWAKTLPTDLKAVLVVTAGAETCWRGCIQK